MHALVVFIIVAICGLGHGDVKVWQRDVNFGNPDNWSSGKVPCASDSIQFPETVGVVFMQTNTTLKEIRLPMNGILVLDKNINVAFTDDASVQPDCIGQDQMFSHDTAESWFDPTNWEGSNGVVSVDTENVPCKFDKAVFPLEKLFYVGVDVSTTLGTVTFSGEDFLSTSAFSSFLSSPAGQQQFSLSNSPTIQLQNTQCGDLTGCICGNDIGPVYTKICGLRGDSCPALSCAEAPTPVGGCCQICGAILTMEYDAQSFNFENFKSSVENTYGLGGSGVRDTNSARKKRQSGSGVEMYMSKTREGKIQMVLTDSNSGSSSGLSAINLAADIESDISQNPGQYGLTSISSQSSQKGTGEQSGGVSSGGIAGIIIAVIIIVCVVSTLVFMFLRRNSFAMKDEPLHADIELSSSIPPGFMQEIPNPAFDSAVRGFDNPIYGPMPVKENLYANPMEVKLEAPNSKSEYVVEEKGPMDGPYYEEDDNIKSFTNPMSFEKHDESLA